jgi:hypothetical protein
MHTNKFFAILLAAVASSAAASGVAKPEANTPVKHYFGRQPPGICVSRGSAVNEMVNFN